MPVEAPRFSPDELRKIISLELELHPLADVADLYKLVNQALYGPTHIDPDPDRIVARLQKEFDEMVDVAVESLQDIGCGHGFFRIGLPALKLLDMRAAAELLLASRLPQMPSLSTLQSDWLAALPVVGSFVNPSTLDLARIDSALRDNTLPRHTELYRQAYHPHYRVVHISQLRKIPQLSQLIRSAP